MGAERTFVGSLTDRQFLKGTLSRRRFIGTGAAIAGALLLPVESQAAPDNERRYRWDIVQDVPDIVPGGEASALASDKSKITLTGSGTFEAGNFGNDVTGGGTWKTFNEHGVVTGTGTYTVTTFVTFTEAPGTLPSDTKDLIGKIEDARAGLVVLGISYSDGKQGVLVYSCMLDGTPESVLEGITASKGFVDYWNSVIAGVTVFHVLPDKNEP
jgi:hypothetical protein